ncbi:MAG: TatD family hydrolase [Bacteroidia bacterium]|jgi:TatD DNase family protein|nr:TatD family hydrolase [Bacteroidia bacterium]
MQFIDTHTHLYAKEFQADRSALINKAIHNQIHQFYLPNIDSDSIEPMLALEKEFPEQCFALMGLHPCSVNLNVNEELKIVRKWLEKRPFAGIGEIGLDMYWDKTYAKEQTQAFKTQIEWALEFNYPIVIHVRNAFKEILAVLKTFSNLPKGIFHCFSGNLEEANEILALGHFKLGLGGVLTFKNSGLDKVVQSIDIKHLVLETDAPYLAPAPHRGKRNEPSYLLEVAKKLAELKNLGIDTVAEITSSNASEIFKKP